MEKEEEVEMAKQEWRETENKEMVVLAKVMWKKGKGESYGQVGYSE